MAYCCHLAFLLLLFFASGCATKPHHGELQTLLTIQREWGNPAALSTWKPNSSHHCNWTGVGCNSNGQVTALSFKRFHIANPIPASICSLEYVSYIDLSYNKLSGEFPTVLYSCSPLRYLDLSFNEFTGRLPGDINRISSKMQHLNLSSNGFTGSVPSAIGGFQKLKSLVIDANRFDGCYPAAAISSLVELELLGLGDNPFRPGPVPNEFCEMKKLKVLWMPRMNLTGGIPDSLSALTELTLLNMTSNMLRGTIPKWLWKHQKLEHLSLGGNNFIGEIGPDITAVSMLWINLSTNKLTGPIPGSIGHLPNLSFIWLSYNSLSGTLPPELGKHSPLQVLSVSNNLLSGGFPASLGQCGTLKYIWAENNRFDGKFPQKIWSLPNLIDVSIDKNGFTGTLPTELSASIERIWIADNRFSGLVPRIGAGLRVFSARNNRFSGQLC